MIERSVVVAQARTWLDTPFHHQGRVKGVGADCAGLVIGVARELGIVDKYFDVTSYPKVPDGMSLMRLANDNMVPIMSKSDMQPGDVVVVAFDKDPQHFGILGDYAHGGLSIIHAASAHKKVIETRLMFSSSMYYVAAFKLPGVH